MNIELIIDSAPNEVVIAFLKNGRLIELHREKSNNSFSVGDVYLGKIRKVVPSLNAAFVNVGYEKDAFLHYLDLGPQFSSLNKFVKRTITRKLPTHDLTEFPMEKDIDKNGKIANVLSSSQNILVQVAKEPISSKGPRLTSEITLAGRFVVLVPFSNKISLSQKISDPAERERLKRLISSIRPKNFGVIIRTVAQNKKVAELDADLKGLVAKWEACYKALKSSRPPKKVLGELDRTAAIVRDMMDATFNNIHVNDAGLAEEIKSYLRTIAPEKEGIVKLYNGRNGIFDHFGIQKQIKASFGKHVSMKSGAYLIIEHTEAMHVIDVNSGNRKSPSKNQEENAIEVNLEAAEEIARQLRLRDMGGIIAVDFIDMSQAANRKKLFNGLKEFLREDRAKHNLIPPSKFGVVEITRQRVRPEMDIKTSETCPVCKGSGEVQATILLIDEIENNLRYLVEEKKIKELTLAVHPFVEAYLTKTNGFLGLGGSISKKWSKKWGQKINIHSATAYNFLDYRFLNGGNEEIKV